MIDYFQKAPVDVLAREAVIEGTSDCALDIGLVSLAPRAAHAFLELGRTRTNGGTLLEALSGGRLRFDLYLEVLTACLAALSFEAFWERVERASALPRDLARRRVRGVPPLRPRRHGHAVDRVRARGEHRRAARGEPRPAHAPGHSVLRGGRG